MVWRYLEWAGLRAKQRASQRGREAVGFTVLTGFKLGPDQNGD